MEVGEGTEQPSIVGRAEISNYFAALTELVNDSSLGLSEQKVARKALFGGFLSLAELSDDLGVQPLKTPRQLAEEYTDTRKGYQLSLNSAQNGHKAPNLFPYQDSIYTREYESPPIVGGVPSHRMGLSRELTKISERYLALLEHMTPEES